MYELEKNNIYFLFLVKVQNKISIIRCKVYKLFLTFKYMNKYVHIYSSKSKVQLIKK